MSLQQKFYCESRYPDKMPEYVHGQIARIRARTKWQKMKNMTKCHRIGNKDVIKSVTKV